MSTRILSRDDLDFRRRALQGLSPLQREIVHALLTASDEPDDAIAIRCGTNPDEVRRERGRALAILKVLAGKRN